MGYNLAQGNRKAFPEEVTFKPQLDSLSEVKKVSIREVFLVRVLVKFSLQKP